VSKVSKVMSGYETMAGRPGYHRPPHVTGRNDSADTSPLLGAEEKPASEAMIRSSGPDCQRFEGE
jgi:hypothetical protein